MNSSLWNSHYFSSNNLSLIIYVNLYVLLYYIIDKSNEAIKFFTMPSSDTISSSNYLCAYNNKHENCLKRITHDIDADRSTGKYIIETTLCLLLY